MRAAAVLGTSPRRLKAGDLAGALGTTSGFVPQVVGPLVKQGWVRSEPGPQGGYGLTVPASGLSVLEIIEAVDGPTDTGQCVVTDGPCSPQRPCVLHVAWSTARAELVKTLAARPVSTVLGDPSPARTESAP